MSELTAKEIEEAQEVINELFNFYLEKSSKQNDC